MHSDMMAMGMPGDPAYEALADSVVQGSARLGTASGAGFDRLVPCISISSAAWRRPTRPRPRGS